MAGTWETKMTVLDIAEKRMAITAALGCESRGRGLQVSVLRGRSLGG